MGQPVTVVERPSSRPGIVRFNINRSLTGMAHERYAAGDEITGDRPPDELARRLFELGGAQVIHMNSNVITVELATGADGAGMAALIEDLFIHYRDGVVPEPPSTEPEGD